VIVSVLDDAALERMRAEAAAEAGPFVNPALLRDAETVLPVVPRAWLSRVVRGSRRQPRPRPTRAISCAQLPRASRS